MAYKCCNCGHIFEDGEQYRWEESHGERFSGCPVCKGGYAPTSPCKVCGSEKTERELYDGICLSCLREDVTMDVAIAYLRDKKLLVNFVFYTIFNADEPTSANEKLEAWCEFIVHEIATKEQLVAYIIAEAEDFANWLNAQEVRK